MATPAAIAFDLDGTLIDSRRDIVDACNHVLVWAGRAPLPPEVIGTFVGDGGRTLLARAFGVPVTDGPDPQLDAWQREWVAFYSAHPAVHTTWMPGALALLDAVAGLPLAVLTNKARPVALAVLDALGGRERFAFVYGGGDGPLKPRPEPVLMTARALSVEPSSLWVVGDADQDILAARAAGAVAVAVRGGFQPDARLEAARPDVMVDSLEQLLPLIQRAAS
jgi:phosphoglycolate phosphatase